MVRLAAVSFLVLITAACGGGDKEKQCLVSSNCDLEPGGTCNVYGPSGKQWCQYPDTACGSGRRWSDFETGDGLSGACVADDGPDAGVGDASVADASLIDAPPGTPDAATDDAMPQPDAGPVQMTFKKKMTASNAGANTRYGTFVAIDASRIAVGGGQKENNTQNPGFAYALSRGAADWSEDVRLLPGETLDNGDSFGHSVSVSGDLIVAGANGDDESSQQAGAAYVFEWQTSQWVETKKLLPAVPEAFDLFGHSVAVAPGVILVGAPQAGTSGVAYVFEQTGGGAWVQVKALSDAAASAGDKFGLSVAASADVLVVGTAAGAAYVYKRSTVTSEWELSKKLTPADSTAGFGSTVAVSSTSDVVVVGAVGDTDNGASAGAAYVFEEQSMQWTQVKKIKPGDGAAGAQFGGAVSAASGVILVGAQGDDSGAGAAYLFERETSQWVQKQKFIAPDASAGAAFGASVATTTTKAVVGAHFESGAASNAGAVYIYER